MWCLGVSNLSCKVSSSPNLWRFFVFLEPTISHPFLKVLPSIFLYSRSTRSIESSHNVQIPTPSRLLPQFRSIQFAPRKIRPTEPLFYARLFSKVSEADSMSLSASPTVFRPSRSCSRAVDGDLEKFRPLLDSPHSPSKRFVFRVHSALIYANIALP